jgi:hypothetical protein
MVVQATVYGAAQHAPRSFGRLDLRKAAELSHNISSAKLLNFPAAGSIAVRAARAWVKIQRMLFIERSPDAKISIEAPAAH